MAEPGGVKPGPLFPAVAVLPVRGAHDGPEPRSGRTELPINTVIWIAIGAALGYVFTQMMKPEGRTAMIENVAVGIFGSFVGGEFVGDQIRGAPSTNFSVTGLALAAAGAVVMLVLLRVMRGAVGPLKQGKAKRER
jgi:uncharacterized membrane protein YeaQ/YmgE (transglycosylase-associated protein family)